MVSELAGWDETSGDKYQYHFHCWIRSVFSHNLFASLSEPLLKIYCLCGKHQSLALSFGSSDGQSITSMMVTEGQMYYFKMRITAERNIADISSYKPDKTAAVSFYVVLWHKNLFFILFLYLLPTCL